MQAVTSYLDKIRSLAEMKALCSRLKAEGKRVVFTNGCFDILHPGHARYLEAARALGDVLIVAVNSDRSVRAIKGQQKPILPEAARAEMVAALCFVDGVVIFDEDTPLDVIRELIPDVLVKGGDWAEKDIVGADLVKAAGGQVKRIPYVTGFSTTGIIDTILHRMR
jgi:D-beta-D-heptose 7-phosphate kinase/D-beta-D-heptose 1-phosphate adenosyltransferase